MSDLEKYSVYDFPLHEVASENITLSKDEGKIYDQNMKMVLESIVNQMKTDETFRLLYRSNSYVESAYENLRISKPNEFDINIFFEWPESACQVIYDSMQPGYVKLKINLDNPALKKMRADAPSFDKQLKKWIDTNGFFLRKSFKAWMHGRVFKAKDAVSLEDTQIKLSISGPALTLKIQQNSEKLNYSVDLLPAFLFNEKDWPKPPVRHLSSSIKCKEWSVIPKEPTSETEPVYWRMTFNSQEKELMDDQGSVKHVIKLIKLLRDKEKWINDLHNYAIETIFLWECEKLEAKFWKQGLGFLFVYMLRTLAYGYLANGKILYYWDERLNLIKMKESTRRIIKDRICIVLKGLNSSIENPYSIKKYFGCVPEKMLQNSSDINLTSSLIDLDEPDTSEVPNSLAVNLPQNLLEIEIKPEIEEINIDVHCTDEYNMCASNARDDTDSPAAIELLRSILKEQQETKDILQSVLSQLNELSEEVKILRQENAQLKKQLQGSAKESISTSASINAVDNLLSLRNLSISDSPANQKCFSDISQASEIPQKSLIKSNEFLKPDPIFKQGIDDFSQLLPDNFGKN